MFCKADSQISNPAKEQSKIAMAKGLYSTWSDTRSWIALHLFFFFSKNIWITTWNKLLSARKFSQTVIVKRRSLKKKINKMLILRP